MAWTAAYVLHLSGSQGLQQDMNSVLKTIQSGSDVSCAAVNLRRLAAIGIGLPALLVVANQFVLSQRMYVRSGPVLIAFVMAFYVLQIGTIGWVVGSYVKNGILRWFMFGWIMILIDLQLAVITSDGAAGVGGSCLATGILTGQLGIITVWGVLGKVRWIWRLPCLFVVLMTYRNFYLMLTTVNSMKIYYGNWSDIAMVQSVLLSVLAGMLRLSGYSLTRADMEQSSPTANARFHSARQFGIRDVLIWTASLAVLLGVARAGKFLNVEFIKRFYGAEMLLVFTIAVCSSAIMVVAIWASLGEGSVWLRSGVLVILSTSIGVSVGVYCAIVGRRTGRWLVNSIWIYAEYWWIGWMILTGLLLSASLLIFRTQGIRLVKRVSRSSTEIATAPHRNRYGKNGRDASDDAKELFKRIRTDNS